MASDNLGRDLLFAIRDMIEGRNEGFCEMREAVGEIEETGERFDVQAVDVSGASDGTAYVWITDSTGADRRFRLSLTIAP